MSSPLQILILSDQRAGHLNQSRGLAAALEKLTPVESRILPVDPSLPGLRRLRKARMEAENLARPDLVIATGHRTHLAALALKKKFRAPLVLIMRPSLPLFLFDLCLIPHHDLEERYIPTNVVPTRGALSRLSPSPQTEKTHGLILVGGPSKTHRWDPAPLREAIETITADSAFPWHLTDSRRTPAGFLDSLADLPIELHPHEKTSPDWLPEQLRAARQAWVTADSISMIHEALTAGVPTGLLPLPVSQPNRLTRATDRLVSENQVLPFTDWREGKSLPEPRPLAEAPRCAREVLSRFFPDRLPA